MKIRMSLFSINRPFIVGLHKGHPDHFICPLKDESYYVVTLSISLSVYYLFLSTPYLIGPVLVPGLE